MKIQKRFTQFLIYILLICFLIILFYLVIFRPFKRNSIQPVANKISQTSLSPEQHDSLVNFHPFKKCFTHLVTDNITQISLSPDRRRILYRDETRHLIIIDTLSGRKLYDSNRTKEQTIIEAYWNQDSSLIVSRKTKSEPKLSACRTQNFKNFSPLRADIPFRWNQANYLAPDLRTNLRLSKTTKRLTIQDNQGKLWDTSIAFDYTRLEWSPDSRLLILTNDQNMIMFNTATRKIIKMPWTEAIGLWAPQRNMKVVTFPETDAGESLFLLDCDRFQQTKLTTGGESPSLTYGIWSPEGRYFYATGSTIYKFDTQHPKKPGKRIYDFSNFYGKEFFISADGNALLFTYNKEPKFFKMSGNKFYVIKLDLRTGSTQKIGIPSYTGEIMWVNQNTYYYTKSLFDYNTHHAFQLLHRVSLKWK